MSNAASLKLPDVILQGSGRIPLEVRRDSLYTLCELTNELDVAIDERPARGDMRARLEPGSSDRRYTHVRSASIDGRLRGSRSFYFQLGQDAPQDPVQRDSVARHMAIARSM